MIAPTIRKALPRDTAFLWSLIEAHARYEGGKATIGLDTLEKLLSNSDARPLVFVAECEGYLVGYAALSFEFSFWHGRGFAHLDCLFVSEENRSCGVGEALFAAAKACAREAGIHRMEWQTPAENQGAIRFYERLGATGLAKRRFSLTI